MTKTLGIVWNNSSDTLKLSILSLSSPPSQIDPTKRSVVSDVAKTFDILGWFSPTTIIAKILLLRCWEQKVNWDGQVPQNIGDAWHAWRNELHLLSEVHIPCCYFNGVEKITLTELHDVCDAS